MTRKMMLPALVVSLVVLTGSHAFASSGLFGFLFGSSRVTQSCNACDPVQACEKAAPAVCEKAAPAACEKAAPLACEKAAPAACEKIAPPACEKAAPLACEKAAPLACEKAVPEACERLVQPLSILPRFSLR